MSAAADLYLLGVAIFTTIALKDRSMYGRGFLFDFFTTALIMVWPITVLLMLTANIATGKKG